jgi:hypothetical protein
MESQWSHGNRCYRCRHGHTTAHLPADRPATNLHLREDVVLARAFARLAAFGSKDQQIQQHLAKIRQGNKAVDLAEFLRTYQITIICHQERVSLQINSTALAARDNTDLALASATIPRQRVSSARTSGYLPA